MARTIRYKWRKGKVSGDVRGSSGSSLNVTGVPLDTMSAMGSKADLIETNANVRFVLKADLRPPKTEKLSSSNSLPERSAAFRGTHQGRAGLCRCHLDCRRTRHDHFRG